MPYIHPPVLVVGQKIPYTTEMRISVRGEEKKEETNKFGVIGFRFPVDARFQKILKMN